MMGRTGLGRYVETLARKLGPQGVRLFCSATPQAEEFRRRGWEVRLVGSKVFSLREQWELPRAIKAECLDLFHSPQFNVPLFSGVNRVTTLNDCTLDRFPDILPSPYARFYYRAMMRSATRRSVLLIVPSDASKKDLMDFYGVPEERIAVIPLGVDRGFFRPLSAADAENSHIRQEGTPDEVTILYVGTSHPHKNLGRLMRALRLIGEARPANSKGVKLVCVGPFTPRFPRPSELAHQESVGPRVVEKGKVSDAELLPLMHAATVLVLPSLAEGFGLTALEAMACGLPVLLSRIPPLVETAGDAAEYFDPSRPEDLAERLRHLLDNPARRTELIEKGFHRAAKFSWEACAEATLEVYRRAASRHTTRSPRTPA